jgi:hypothetical protein
MNRRRDEYRDCPLIKFHKCGGEAIEMPRLDALLLYVALERMTFVEATHDYEPVHNRSTPAE